MDTNNPRFSVELRRDIEWGEDYTEDHYEFATEAEAVAFAKENRKHLHSILEYAPGKNYDPKDITYRAGGSFGYNNIPWSRF